VPTATGTFEIERRPAPPEGHGALARHDFTKKFNGSIEGTGIGVMISAGDPASGAAGYVAMEVITGHLDGRRGSFALQQYGTMSVDGQRLEYAIVPGSGDGELAGILGRLNLSVEDGIHHYALEYEL
jgi:Protein of unknown function (DUF3224)